MSTKMWVVLLLCMSVAVQACYNRAHFVPSTSTKYAPRVADSRKVQTFPDEPSGRKYEVLGLLSGSIDTSIRDVIDNIPVLQQKAWEVGADAIIKIHCHEGALGRSRCEAVAIRFLD